MYSFSQTAYRARHNCVMDYSPAALSIVESLQCRRRLACRKSLHPALSKRLAGVPEPY